MTLSVFPNVANPVYPLDEGRENPAISSQMENGMVISRPRFTRIRKKWILKWTALKNNEYQLLMNFWEQMCGGSQEFQWVNPVTGVSYIVRFTGEINFHLTSHDMWEGEITLQEV
jgi:hypothetical protein